MARYIVHRLLLLIPTLLGILLVTFLALHLIPGDPTHTLLGQHATPAAQEALRRQLGLDQPLPIQLLRYLETMLRLDLGESVITRRPVLQELKERMPVTVTLTFAAMLIASGGGILLGILAAVRRRTWVDYLGMGLALFGVSMPIFWLGLLLVYYFAVVLGWFEPSGIASVTYLNEVPRITGFFLVDALLTGHTAAFWNGLWHLVLPAVALGTVPMALIARITRSSMLEVMGQDYIRTARAKGLKERWVVWRHALKNALLPVITVIGLQFGTLLSGAVITESIFALPGMGRYIVNAIFNRDYPAVQGAVILFAFLFVILNLLVDLLYSWLDPRIRYQ
ncbi:MAG: ABC transporter permease [Clostridiales bacterium]|nr:ABC transporter permease [Clostridiales bacterium]